MGQEEVPPASKECGTVGTWPRRRVRHRLLTAALVLAAAAAIQPTRAPITTHITKNTPA